MELPLHYNQTQYFDKRSMMKELELSQEDIKRFNAARGMLSKLATTDPSSEFNETVPSINQDRAAYNESSETGTGANTGTFKKAVPAQNIQSQGQAQGDAAAVPMEDPNQMMPEGPEAMGARAAQSFLGPDIMSAAMSGDTAAMDLIARTAGQVAGAVTEFAMRGPAGNGGAGNGGEMGMDPSQVGAEGEQGGMMAPGGQMGGAAPAPITTPEQDLASEIVPPVAANPPQMPAGQENGNGTPEAQKAQNGAPEEKKGFPPASDNKNGAPGEKKGFPPAKGSSENKGGDDDKIDLQTVAKLIQAAMAGKI
jgi:hypothetical protein